MRRAVLARALWLLGAGGRMVQLGIRATRGRSYHGLAINVDMDLSPFAAIDPCGFPGLAVTQLKDLGVPVCKVGNRLADNLMRNIEHA